MKHALALVLLVAAVACTDGVDCPDSLNTSSAEWRAPAEATDQCVELARALNGSGLELGAGDDAGDADCVGHMAQTSSGGTCRASISGVCEGGLSYELDCDVKRDRTADCSVLIDAPELDRACRLRVLLR